MGQPMDQIRDKDLASAMLNDLKFTCECLGQKILETSNTQLRQNYINILSESYNEQNQLYSLMSQRGWHQPMMANQQDVSQVTNQIMKMQNEINHTINTGQQQTSNYQANYSQKTFQGHQPY
ncbi:MAG: spore coat protein [Firmicutes bacterium]|nr:spore coat protein [Bacillota bacterium]